MSFCRDFQTKSAFLFRRSSINDVYAWGAHKTHLCGSFYYLCEHLNAPIYEFGSKISEHSSLDFCGVPFE
jgi:hypothetical protein